MIYTCNTCLFEFEADTVPASCPDCGSSDIRPATTAEISEYYRNHRQEVDWGKQSAG